MLIYRPTFVSYDISNDLDRARARDHLRLTGGWVQRSLWMAPRTTEAYVEGTVAQLLPFVGPTDRLLVHRPCLACLSNTMWRPQVHFRMERRGTDEVV